MKHRWSKWSIVSAAAVAFLTVVGLSIPMSRLTLGQQAQAIGVPGDWTHHHLVFSNPGSFADAMKNGSFLPWYRIVTDPRFTHQQIKLNAQVRRYPGSPGRPAKPPSARLDWSMDLGPASTIGTVGADQYPAKYAFFLSSGITSASCASDFVVFNTSLGSTTTTEATIIAYNNLYSGCSGTVPSVYWQYDTDYATGSTTLDGSTAKTSVVLSGDGSQVAFVENNTTPVASLVLLRWKSNSSLVSMSGSLNVANTAYQNCSAPCMTRMTFSNSAEDTNSPPFYDYLHDIIYVGDNSGVMHKFTGVFGGSPAESTANGWPVTVSTQTSKILTGAVYDPSSTLLFVGDSTGYLYSVTTTGSSSQTVVRSGQIAHGTSGISDAPLVDSTPTTPVVYAFVGDTSTTTGGVFQFAHNFAAGTTGIEETVGTGSTSSVMYIGAFDNLHYTSSGGTGGNLYVCGYHTGGTVPRLFGIAMNSTFTGTVTTIGTLATSAATCSPVTEFLNGTTDWMFLSVTAGGSSMGTPACSGACLYNYNITSALTGTSVATAGLAATGGTSGIIIDNSATSPTGTSEIYFSSLGSESCAGNGSTGSGTGGCAVQATQSAP